MQRQPQRQAREAIKRSFCKLLDQKPLHQITVKAIVEDCGVNRNSFYYHFEDIPALVEEITREDVERLTAEYADAPSLQACLDATIRLALENRRIALHLYRSARRDLFERYLCRLCHDLAAAYCARIYGDGAIGTEDREILIRFYQCELVGQTLLWLESDMRYDIRAQFARLIELRGDLGAETAQKRERERK